MPTSFYSQNCFSDNHLLDNNGNAVDLYQMYCNITDETENLFFNQEGVYQNEERLSFQIHGQEGPHSYRYGYDTGNG